MNKTEVINVVDWLLSSGLRILAILVATFLVNHFSTMIIRRLVSRAVFRDKHATDEDEQRRENTLVSIIATSVHVVVWVVAAMLILAEFGVSIGPLIASAGILGFAIAFGAQSLVGDFLAGIFIIMENQYRIGDIVELDGVSGEVQDITMRITVLRDLDGNVHYIPNGNIKHSTNKTMEYSKINMSVGVSYDDDIEKVEKVINQVGQELAGDPIWGKLILKAPYFARVNEFDDSSVQIKIFGDTAPGEHWAVAGELRKRLKVAFDKASIEIPYPQRVIHQSKK